MYNISLLFNKLERDFQIIKAPFNKSERKLDNGRYDRFG